MRNQYATNAQSGDWSAAERGNKAVNKAWREPEGCGDQEPKRAVGIESRRRTEHEAAAYGSALAVQRRHVAPAHEMYGSAAHSSRTDGGAQ